MTRLYAVKLVSNKFVVLLRGNLEMFVVIDEKVHVLGRSECFRFFPSITFVRENNILHDTQPEMLEVQK